MFCIEGLLLCRVLPHTSCLCLFPICFLCWPLRVSSSAPSLSVSWSLLKVSVFLSSSDLNLISLLQPTTFCPFGFPLSVCHRASVGVVHLGSFSYTVTPDWASRGQQKNIYSEPWTVVFSKAELLGRSSKGRKSSTCMISDRSTYQPLVKPWFKVRGAFTKNTSWHQLLVFCPDTVNPPFSSSSTLPVLYQQVCACTSV